MNQHDRPTAIELLEAVREFLGEHIRPNVEGRLSFHTLVAMNALGAVERELAQGPALEAESIDRLEALLDLQTDAEHPPGARLEELERELCRRIREGEIGLDSEPLMEHLSKVTKARLAIDNPKYRTVDHGF